MRGVRPMLATAADALPAGDGWTYEFKWDGVRALIDINPERVTVTGRTGADITASYPELVALARRGVEGEGGDDALIDGEIVALRDGRPSFEALQPRMHVRSAASASELARTTPVVFMAFDLLRCYGVDLTERPLAERRATLERWAADRAGWTVSPVFDDGPATEAAARENHLEGVMAKRSGSRYRPGARSTDWMKLRFVRTGDFAVVGYEAASDHPSVLSSLLLAARDGDRLVFAGKVGSGLDARSVRALHGRLRARGSAALDEPPEPTRGRLTTWVEPGVVVEVRYAQWTGDLRLRHPVLVRIRPDKVEPDPLPSAAPGPTADARAGDADG